MSKDQIIHDPDNLVEVANLKMWYPVQKTILDQLLTG